MNRPPRTVGQLDQRHIGDFIRFQPDGREYRIEGFGYPMTLGQVDIATVTQNGIEQTFSVWTDDRIWYRAA